MALHFLTTYKKHYISHPYLKRASAKEEEDFYEPLNLVEILGTSTLEEIEGDADKDALIEGLIRKINGRLLFTIYQRDYCGALNKFADKTHGEEEVMKQCEGMLKPKKVAPPASRVMKKLYGYIPTQALYTGETTYQVWHDELAQAMLLDGSAEEINDRFHDMMIERAHRVYENPEASDADEEEEPKTAETEKAPVVPCGPTLMVRCSCPKAKQKRK